MLPSVLHRISPVAQAVQMIISLEWCAHHASLLRSLFQEIHVLQDLDTAPILLMDLTALNGAENFVSESMILIESTAANADAKHISATDTTEASDDFSFENFEYLIRSFLWYAEYFLWKTLEYYIRSFLWYAEYFL